MTVHLFKTRSIEEIEACLSAALSELLGSKVKVDVDALKITGREVMVESVEMSLKATKELDYGLGIQSI